MAHRSPLVSKLDCRSRKIWSCGTLLDGTHIDARRCSNELNARSRRANEEWVEAICKGFCGESSSQCGDIIALTSSRMLRMISSIIWVVMSCGNEAGTRGWNKDTLNLHVNWIISSHGPLNNNCTCLGCSPSRCFCR